MARIKRNLTKKRNTEDHTEKYERIAEIKSIIKSLDDEAKTIQGELLALDVKAEKINTEYGTLTLRIRENWKVIDKIAIFKELGKEEYIDKSTISKTGIVKSIGEKGFFALQDKDVVELSSVSEYYQLSK